MTGMGEGGSGDDTSQLKHFFLGRRSFMNLQVSDYNTEKLK